MRFVEGNEFGNKKQRNRPCLLTIRVRCEKQEGNNQVRKSLSSSSDSFRSFKMCESRLS